MFERLRKTGWDGDGASNGVFLPGTQKLSQTINLPGHWSSHLNYTQEIRKKVTILSSRARGLTDTQLALGVKNIQDWARAGLENGIFKTGAIAGRLI